MNTGWHTAGWSAAAPMAGGVAWIILLLASGAGVVPLGIIEQLFLLAPLLIVPLGLSLLDDPTSHNWSAILRQAARFIQPLAAGLVVASFLVPRGRVAASLMIGWLLVTGVVGLAGLLDLLRVGLRRAEALCFVAGQLYLLLGGVGFVSSRLGATPLGFVEPLILLFAVHYHYTGFVVPLVTGATAQALDPSSKARRFIFPAVATGVLAGPAVIAAGFVLRAAGFDLSGVIIILGVFVLAASLLVLAALLFMVMIRARGRAVKVLIGVSAASLVVSMVLACIYSAGEFAGNLILDVHQMAWLHGILNAFGFSLCSLTGFLLIRHGDRQAQRRPWPFWWQDILCFAFGTFHFVLAALAYAIIVYRPTGFGVLVGELTTPFGIILLAALWTTTCWSARRTLQEVDLLEEGSRLPMGRLLVLGCAWGGINGGLFLLTWFVTAGAFDGGIEKVAVMIFYLIALLFPLPLAFAVGGIFGLHCILLDLPILVLLRRRFGSGA